MRPEGPAQNLAARFHPDGALQVFDLPDRSGLHPRGRHAERESIEELEASSWRAPGPADPIVADAVRRLIRRARPAASPRPCISPRQLERRFKRQVGIGPKLFCRIQRFQRVFREIESGGNWVQAALACGYYDQAHLVRDMRQFSGETPTALVEGRRAGPPFPVGNFQDRPVAPSHEVVACT